MSISSIYWPVTISAEKRELFQVDQLPLGMPGICKTNEEASNNQDYLTRRLFDKSNMRNFRILRKVGEKWPALGNMVLPNLWSNFLLSGQSSVFMNGSIFSCGGSLSSRSSPTYHHEELRIKDKVVLERKKMPVTKRNHAAAQIDQNRYMIMGGKNSIWSVCKITLEIELMK